MQVKNARVLITGAGSGLGRALALKFAAAGSRVAVTDIREDGAQQTLAEIQRAGAQGLSAALDVTQEKSFADIVGRMQRGWDGIDVLINNAGVATAGTVADSPLEQWQWVLNINLLGCVRGARAAIPAMQAQGSGHIVNIASFAGIANPPAMASYNAAKAAVISLSETLRFELYPQIGVSVVCPSFFKTDLLNSGRGQLPESAHTSAPQMEKIIARLMEKASVTADDVAADILDSVEKNRFMVMPHADARQRALLKRISPEIYFRRAQKMLVPFLQKPRV